MCLLVHALSISPALAATVKVETVHSQDRYPMGERYPLFFRLTIDKPWYIHGTKAEDSSLIPTVLSFPESSGIRVEEILFPAPEKKKFDYTPHSVEVFSGDVLVKAALAVKGNALAGEQVIQGNLSYQACSSSACLPPESIPVAISFSIVPQGTPTTPLNQYVFLAREKIQEAERGFAGISLGGSLWLTLLGIFFGGLALNLTPCVYPLIPITVSYFTGRSGQKAGRPILHAILYMCGLAVTNSSLGLSAALSGGMLGSALQSPFVLLFVAGILVLLALSFFGLWELRIPMGLTRIASMNYGGYSGSLFMGLTLGIVAAPCLGPFILGLLAYVGQKGDPFLGFLYFFVLSIGLGLPLALLGLFSGAIHRLPHSGDWMLWTRKLMGWILVGMAAYMSSPLVASAMGRAGLFAGVAFVSAVHLGWIDRTGSLRRHFLLLKRALGLVVMAGAIFYLILAGYERKGIDWAPYERDLLSAAVIEKKPVMLDFYADWCEPCRVMEKQVFRDPEVVTRSRDFVTVRLDLTTRQPHQEEVLRQYGVRGVPTVIFLNKEGIEEKGLRIESLVDRSQFLDRMNQLLNKSSSSHKQLPPVVAVQMLHHDTSGLGGVHKATIPHEQSHMQGFYLLPVYPVLEKEKIPEFEFPEGDCLAHLQLFPRTARNLNACPLVDPHHQA